MNQEINIASMIEIEAEEITSFVQKNCIDAIVNAASPMLMGSRKTGVDKKVHEVIDRKMGERGAFNKLIREEVDKGKELPVNVVRCQRGQAIVTSGDKFSKYVIHVVGTKYDGPRHDRHQKKHKKGKENNISVSSSCVQKLENCYLEIVRQIRTHPDIRTVAIPVISSGNYGFPFELAVRIALVSLGNALTGWKNEDPELFDDSLLKKIYICVYDTNLKKQRSLCKNARKIWRQYRPIFSQNRKAVYQKSFEGHVRYLIEIFKYDGQRGYFAIAKIFRLLLLLSRTLFLPVVILKDVIGGYDWKKRRTVVEFTAFVKLLLPVLMYGIVLTRVSDLSFLNKIMVVITAYMMTDTITYLLTLIVLADIQRPSANVIRSLIFLFINYLEVSLDIAILYYILNSSVITFEQAVQFAILPETVDAIIDSGGNIAILYLNYGVKFFFMTVALGYFSNHMRQRKFSS